MRLLIYGSKRNPNTIASFFIRNLDPAIPVEILGFPDEFAQLLGSRVYRFVYRFFPYWIVREMDWRFIRQVDTFNPTVVLIFKGMEISEASLKEVSRRGIKLVNYNFDHPYVFFSRGTGNRFVRDAIPYYDLHISYSSLIADDLRKKYNVRCAWIPFGFHLSPEDFEKVLVEQRPEINRACFVGNPDEPRVSALKRLVEAKIPVSVYGFGWDKYLQPGDLIEIHPPRRSGSYWTNPLEFWKVLRQYRVQLNFFRPHNEGSHNLRTFEVPAVGGILLTPESAEQKMFFEDGTEIFSYKGFDDLLDQCRFLMSADAEWINKVRSSARSKSVAQDYSYRRRTRDLLSLLKDFHPKQEQNVKPSPTVQSGF